MTELLTSAQMRAIETAAIASGTVTGLELMERAGRGVLAQIFAIRPDLAAPGRALVLCGPGNNGGDGYVVARLLHDRGWQVAVLAALAAPGKGAPDAAHNRALWDRCGATGALGPRAVQDVLANGVPSLVIDAVFGTGLLRPLGDQLIKELATAAIPDAFVVAVDAPSGLCMDSGRALLEGAAALPLRADLTVSFHGPKLGHFLADGPDACGRLAVADIGLGAAGGATTGVRLASPRRADLAKGAGLHKYEHGHALVLAGGAAKGGAARLAARAALRVGAGLVTLACPSDALAENAARLDAVMLCRLNDAAGLAKVLGDPRLNALCLGPGLGVTQRTRTLVAAALESRRPAVLDADALTAFARTPDALFGQLPPDVVLTPHAGEFARLFPDLAARLAEPPSRGPAFSRLDAVRTAAARAGAVVLLKGPDTVIAAPSGAAVVHAAAYDRVAPWLATAGAGDVLAGLITGLLARRFAPLAAAETAVWLHVEAARRFGPGLIAEDLPEALPGVFRDLGL